MTFTPYKGTVPGYGQGLPVKIVSAGDDATLIVNNSTSDPIFLGGDSGVNPERPNTAILFVQGSVTVDGSEDIYGICLSGETAEFQTLPAADQWANPVGVQIAIQTLGLATEATQLQVKTNTDDTVSGLGTVNGTLGSPAQDGTVNLLNTGIPDNISTTGAPLLALSTQWTNSSFPFSPGQSRSIGPVNFGQISYEGLFTFVCGAGDTNPSFTVQFQWIDAATNLTINTETWYPCSGVTPGNTYQASGRAKGSRLTLIITNNGSTSATASVVLNQTSRVYVRDDLRSLVYNGIPSVANGGYDPTANLLLETAPTVGTSSPAQRSMALYCGTVRLEGFTTLGPASFQITTQNDNGLANNTVWTGEITGSGQGTFNQQLDLPRYQCILSIANQHTSSQQIGVSIFISEQNI